MKLHFVAAVVLALSTMAFASDKITIALNWVPEPEFGGIYAAKEQGAFAKNHLDVDIKPGGAGAPTWQRVAGGQVEFGVSSADEVIIARQNGADLVAIFSIYQTCPQGIMVHASRGLQTIDDVFKSGTLAMEIGLPYTKYLDKKYGHAGVKRVPYTGGIANFLADKSFAQQCFVFSEPLAARTQGVEPQTFLIAEAGYNPYTGVVVTSGKYLKEHPATVKAMVASLQQGWDDYLKDPRQANGAMGALNKSMDAKTFADAAEAQKALVEYSYQPNKRPLGGMITERWQTLIDQLVDLKIVKDPPKAAECFIPAAPN
ncbi:hypothetical protein BH10PLA1_BH10PLA1_17570 [soil metagenome]